METRKLQQVGGGTYTVSIPKEWAENHCLEAGVDVHLYTHADGSLVVRSEQKDRGELATAQVHVDGSGTENVARALRAAHAIGFETVTLCPDGEFTPEQRRVARSTLRNLVGAEVLDASEDEITVRNLLDTDEISVRQSVVQLQFVALSIHRAGTAALVDAEDAAHDRLRERDDEADRLLEMVSRHLNRSLVSMAELDRLATTRRELFDHYVTARQLERVADLGVRMARVGGRLPGPPGDERAEEIGRLAEAARGVVDDAASAVLGEPDLAAANRILDDRDETVASIETVRDAIAEESTPEAVALAGAVDALVRTAEHGGNVAEVAVRGAIRDQSL